MNATKKGPEQFLRLVIEGTEYLLPSDASHSIEQRDNLTTSLKDADANQASVCAWYVVRTQRWPAFCLGGDLKPSSGWNWQRAVFLENDAAPIGIVAEEVQLLPPKDMRIESFFPLGQQPTQLGPLFASAWMRAHDIVLVFEPKALVAYLTQIWRGQ